MEGSIVPASIPDAAHFSFLLLTRGGALRDAAENSNSVDLGSV